MAGDDAWREVERERLRDWYSANRLKVREKQKRYYQANREKILKRMKKNYARSVRVKFSTRTD